MRYNKTILSIFFTGITCIFFTTTIQAQSVSINSDGSLPNASAILDVKSFTKGMLLPRTSTTSRLAIIDPAKGLILYDTTTSGFWFHNGSAWAQLSAGSNGWNLTGNAGTNATSNFIGTIDNQPLRLRVNNAWAGEIHPTSGNVFFGLGAGQSNTSGHSNTATGVSALLTNTTGNGNTANGYEALYSTTTGDRNTAYGFNALYSNTTGIANTATGWALVRNTTGNFNTANGQGALFLNTTGDNNTAMGDALHGNTTASQNTGIGSNALFTQSFSNGGTAWGSGNTAVGYAALYANQPTSTSDGINNTAVGNLALTANTTGWDNTGIGTTALYSNTTGVENTATGRQSLFYNTTGSDNTATGYKALRNNNTGSNNTANGVYALYSNTTGTENTADGYQALYSNNAGYENTANGYQALYSNTGGSYNTANGYTALYSNSYGDDNIANGWNALFSNTTGNQNTAIGSGALKNNVGGNNNTAIGYGSGTHPNTPSIYNTISIGNDGLLNAFQNQVFIGNSSTAFIGGKVPWSVISDARVKNTITEDVKGLDFIMKLRPVTYHVSNKAITTLTGNKETPDFPGKYDGEKIKYSGFLAQEVEQAAKGAGYDFSGYATPKNQWSLYTLSYEQFVVPLVKAMQEQQLIIEELKKQMAEMKSEMELLKKKN